MAAGCTGTAFPELPAADANRELAGGYRLGPGDKLRVTVFDEPALTGEFEVGTGGLVAMPLISGVPAAGKTAEALSAAIAAKLSEGGYVIQPRVAVEVLNYRPFYILGEVNKPGEYPYAGNLDVMQAIAKAGGFTARANKGSVIIRRAGWPGAREIRVSEVPLLLAPGDTVTVTESLF